MKSFTLSAADLRQTKRRAALQGMQGVWLIRFPGFVLECRIKPEMGHEVDGV